VLYKNVQNKHYHTVACDASQQSSLQSDSSSHTDHFSDCQSAKLHPGPVTCFCSSHTCDLVCSFVRSIVLCGQESSLHWTPARGPSAGQMRLPGREEGNWLVCAVCARRAGEAG